MTEECKHCANKFKQLTDKKVCYYCFREIYGRAPNKKEYGGHELEKNE